MIKYLSILMLVFCISCQDHQSVIADHVFIKIYTYEDENKIKASAMPELKPDSEFIKYKRRLEYLLINVPEIHAPGKSAEINEIFNLYPDTVEMKRRYLDKFIQDKKLTGYFERTIIAITDRKNNTPEEYTVDELMDVASKFFYCDEVAPDTSIQAHVCIGLNGLKEANWKKDYTLLEAFCYEGIFNDFDNETSGIWDSFVSKKSASCELFKGKITTLDQYLENVKLDLFMSMKKDEILKKKLVDYYELNRTNLAFTIIN